MEVAYNSARVDALSQTAEPVPSHIRNGVTSLMRDIGYGKGYQYAHDTEEKLTNMRCLPDSLLGREYYRPTTQGLESATGCSWGRNCCMIRLELQDTSCCEMGGVIVSACYKTECGHICNLSDNMETPTARKEARNTMSQASNLYTMLCHHKHRKGSHSKGEIQITIPP
jgi:hypothetical protein